MMNNDDFDMLGDEDNMNIDGEDEFYQKNK